MADPVIPDDDKLADDQLLTDEEREAMGDDDQEEEEEEGEGGAEGDEAQGGEGEGDKKGADAEGAGRDDGGEVDETPAVVDPAPLPLIKDERKEGDAARLEAISTERDALAEQFDEGELTAKEYNSKLRALEKEASELDWNRRKGALAEEMTATQRLQSWQDDVKVFLAANPVISKNQTMMRSYDMVIREVTADEANAALTNTQKLQKAYDQWATDLGLKAKDTATKTADPKAKTEAEKKTADKPQRQPAPPSLRNLPAADVEATSDGRWAELDRLQSTDPMAYEKKIAALSEADFDAYTRAG